MRRSQSRAWAIFLGAVLSACGGAANSSPANLASRASPSASPVPSMSSPAVELPSASTSEKDLGDPVPANGWHEVAKFGGTNVVDEVAGVTFAAGQFVAVGKHYEFASDTSPGSIEGRVWLSSDGLSWEALASDPEFKNVTLTGVVTARDGTLIARGFIDPLIRMQDQIPVYTTWRSTDGRTWRHSDVELATSVVPVGGVASGRKGYLQTRAHDLSLGSGPSGAELWHSLDGLVWDLVYQSADERILTLAAGNEGFVAVRQAPDFRTRLTMASADGREWFDGEPLPEEFAQPSLAALGGDWVLVGRGLEGPPAEPGPVSPGVYDLPVWFSANGLDWQPGANIRWPGDGLGFASPGPLVSVGGRLFLSPSAAGAGPRLGSAGVWSSLDGTNWESTDIPSNTTIVGGAEHDGAVLLVGYGGPGQTATFWRNERP